jgi:chemotaxis protein histidine kinase CheA
VRETDLEWWEEKLAEDQARGLYSFDGRNLSAELENLYERVAEVEDECATKAEQLSRSVREISDALVDLGMLPIWDIPVQPRSAQDVLAAFVLILERLREEHASSPSS